ncbi:glucose-dependent insulinotropic receptor isoform X2 [Clarias gariepinus]|uniref:glucose-dependent insulinotropic receptor isoform X2 n=1 Tax=Clarias gariepinus TaxID=13013 RepID=UPI00234C4A8F|nr:glucose-dependent insulinotropic receptor isoform X2 [Clarias gariepinus]
MMITPNGIIPFPTVMNDYLEEVTSATPVFTTPAQESPNRVVIGWILSIESFLIVFTNLLVAIALVLLIRKGSNHSWSLVLNLAVSDILVGLAITAIAVDDVKNHVVVMQKEMCLLRMSFIIVPSAASIFTMFFISLDRYVAIRVPLRYSQLMGTKMIAGLLVCLWLLSAVLGFLPNMLKTMQELQYKNDILKIAWSHQRRIEQAMQVSSRCLLPIRYCAHIKPFRTVTLLVGCFTLCWCPFFVVNVIQVLCPPCKLYWLIENHLWMLGLANSLINPLVYAFWQREVRQQLCDMFACFKVGQCRVKGNTDQALCTRTTTL